MLQEFSEFDDTLKIASAGSCADYNVTMSSACFQRASESGALASLPTSADKAGLVALAEVESEGAKLCIMDRDFYGNLDQAWAAMVARDSLHETSCVASKHVDSDTLPLSTWIECPQVDESLAAETFGSTYNATSDEESESSEGDSVYELFDDVSVLTADSTMEAIEVQEELLQHETATVEDEEEERPADEEECKDEEELPALEKLEIEDHVPVPESIFTQTHAVENADTFQYDLHLNLQDQPATNSATDDLLLMSFLVNFCADRGR